MANFRELRELIKNTKRVYVTKTENYYTESVQVSGIFIDAVMRVGHNLSNTISRHPVEVGKPIGDHIKPNPVTITLRGVISDDPISFEQFIEDVDNFKNGESSVPLSKFGYDFFVEALQRNASMSIATKFEIYDNMYMKSFKVDETEESYGGMIFTASFEEVIFVESETVSSPTDNLKPVPEPAAAKKAQTKKPPKTTKKKTPTPEKKVIMEDAIYNTNTKATGSDQGGAVKVVNNFNR